MESLQIALADGRVTQSDKLRDYFTGIFEAEESGEEFPVELAHVWPIGYSRKDNAVAALRKSFVEGVDYVSLLKVKEREVGATTEEVFTLSVSCAEYFAVRANREVFDVYRQCRQAVKNLLRGSLPDFSDPAASAEAWAAEYRAKQAALAQVAEAGRLLAAAKPKIDFADAVALAANTVSMSQAAKLLKMPGVGRNKLFAMLRADNVFQDNNEPHQRYINDGLFELEAQPYKAGKNGSKGPRLGITTRVTGRGVEWLQQRYKQAA
jgi:phage antirepressor YoqD-like protein